MRRLICWLIGHRSICLFRHHWGVWGPETLGTEFTGWKCERCGYEFEELYET